MSAVRFAHQALFPLPLRLLPLYRRPLGRPGPHRLSPSPSPPPSEGQGVAGEALGVSRASSSPSSCARSRVEKGRAAGGVVAGNGAVSADSYLTGLGWGGSAVIPPSQPSLVLARSPPLPGPSGLLLRDSQSHSCSPGDCVGRAPALTHPMPPCQAQERLAVSDAETAHARWVLG